jgi:class 3 adenylate cyclase
MCRKPVRGRILMADPMAPFLSDPENPRGRFKRRLRAAFSADIANFSGNVSVSETRAFGNLADILEIGRDELARYEGVLLGVPGDGLFGLFESIVNAVQCALSIQQRLADDPSIGTAMRLRIGVHLGDVLFDGDVPFGETLNIAARLQALADPGGTLVSGAVVDAVSARIPAHFEARGVPQLKNIPRRIATFAVYPRQDTPALPRDTSDSLDQTMQLPSRWKVRDATGSSERRTPPATSAPQEQPPVHPSRPVAAARAPDLQASTEAPRAAEATPVTEESAPTSRAQNSAFSDFDEPLSADVVAFVGDAVSVHLGPVGRMMTARRAKSCGTLGELLATLEADIPSPAEKHAFRSLMKRQFEHRD